MPTYDLKRATVIITEIDSDEKSSNYFEDCKHHLHRIKKFKRSSSDFRDTRRLIQRYRKLSKETRAKHYNLKIYVKKYKKTIEHNYTVNSEHETLRGMVKSGINDAIHSCRMNSRAEDVVTSIKNCSFIVSGKEPGRVFTRPGQLLGLYLTKNAKALYTDKIPTKPKRYIGVELEFCAPVQKNQLALKLFKAGAHEFSQLKEDGSLRPKESETGFELALLLEEANFKKPLKLILDILKSVKATAEDRRAGLHVHIDMRKRDRDLVYNNLVASQRALMSLVHPSREDNEFCQWVGSRKFPTDFTGDRSERYKTINAAAFYKYKTLEVRMHEGSLDYTQIVNWITLLIKISNYPKKMREEINKLTVLSKRINLDKKLYNYLQDRSMNFLFSRERSQHRPSTLLHALTESARSSLISPRREWAQPSEPSLRAITSVSLEDIAPPYEIARPIPSERAEQDV